MLEFISGIFSGLSGMGVLIALLRLALVPKSRQEVDEDAKSCD